MLVVTYRPRVVPSLRPGAVSLSGGETGRCSAVGPEHPRSAAGYTPHTGSRPRPDLGQSNKDGFYTVERKTTKKSDNGTTGDVGAATCRSPGDGVCGTERLRLAGAGVSMSS